jgi:hypothetical protein
LAFNQFALKPSSLHIGPKSPLSFDFFSIRQSGISARFEQRGILTADPPSHPQIAVLNRRALTPIFPDTLYPHANVPLRAVAGVLHMPSEDPRGIVSHPNSPPGFLELLGQ